MSGDLVLYVESDSGAQRRRSPVGLMLYLLGPSFFVVGVVFVVARLEVFVVGDRNCGVCLWNSYCPRELDLLPVDSYLRGGRGPMILGRGGFSKRLRLP